MSDMAHAQCRPIGPLERPFIVNACSNANESRVLFEATSAVLQADERSCSAAAAEHGVASVFICEKARNTPHYLVADCAIYLLLMEKMGMHVNFKPFALDVLRRNSCHFDYK